MTNIRCKGGKEIDLLAINPKTSEKYHVECRIPTSSSFRLRYKETYTSKGEPLRRGLDYFAKEKFYHPHVTAKIHELFGDCNYKKILVIWRVAYFAPKMLIDAKKEYDIEIDFMHRIIGQLLKRRKITGSRDDVLRTIELISIMYKRKWLP